MWLYAAHIARGHAPCLKRTYLTKLTLPICFNSFHVRSVGQVQSTANAVPKRLCNKPTAKTVKVVCVSIWIQQHAKPQMVQMAKCSACSDKIAICSLGLRWPARLYKKVGHRHGGICGGLCCPPCTLNSPDS